MSYNTDVILAFFVGLLLSGAAWAAGAFEKHPCPPTQPGLILRDLEHPPAARPLDREWIVTTSGMVLQAGLNRAQAEGIAAQLGEAFPALKFSARPQIAVEAKP